MCPRSSPAWSNPFFFTVQTEEELLWLSCMCHLSSGKQPFSHFWWSSARLKAYYSNTSYLQALVHLQGDDGSLWDHEWTFWAEHLVHSLFSCYWVFVCLCACSMYSKHAVFLQFGTTQHVFPDEISVTFLCSKMTFVHFFSLLNIMAWTWD